MALLGLTAALRAQGGDKAKVGEAVKADLTRLADLQRSWYEKNRTFTTDLRALGYAPSSGASVTMSYASARSWAANATHPTLAPTSCIIVVSQPGTGGANDKPFCMESAEGGRQVAAAPTQTPAPTARQQPPTPKTESKPVAPAVQTPAASPAAPRPAAPQPQVVVNRRPGRRAAPPAAPVPTTLVEVPARAPSSGAALAATRAAGGAADAGVTEAVTPTQFTERLNAFVAAALDVTNAKMPEVARDPYESTAEYQARVAQAFAVFQRREAEFYARSSRTFVVSIPVKGVKYDADREVVEFAADPIALPTTRSFSTADGARLSVACYTRPYFWCSPDAGMSYDGTDLWRIARATARTADVLGSPLTLMAKFVVGRRDDARSPAVSLISMELQAKGAAISRWESGTR
ncbi:MAG: hypothetical protein P3B98_03700 [Gemmatimonadota bacterium]|nr:hypothetical protein [Gemmatimonadota bacterium]